MSALSEEFVLKAKNGKEIIFARPYLNDEKELMFLHSNFPYHATFTVNEAEKAIEIRTLGSKSVLILLKEENVSFFEKAMKAKVEILGFIRDYMKVLENGQEKIHILETGTEECPYYFTSQTILDKGEYSIKFEKGLMYFINKKVKLAKKAEIYTDYTEMNIILSGHFQNANKSEIRAIKTDGENYEMTFGDLLQIA